LALFLSLAKKARSVQLFWNSNVKLL